MSTVPGDVRLAYHVADIDDDGHHSTGGVTEITDLPTAETDTTLVLAPDGIGGVEWRAETPSGIGELLIVDTGASTPLIFADILQNEAQDDLLYADP